MTMTTKPKFPVDEIKVKSGDPSAKALAKLLKKKADSLSVLRDDLRTLADEAGALADVAEEAIYNLDAAVDTLSGLV